MRPGVLGTLGQVTTCFIESKFSVSLTIIILYASVKRENKQKNMLEKDECFKSLYF